MLEDGTTCGRSDLELEPFLRNSLSFLTDVPGDVRLNAWQCSPMQMDTFRRSSFGFESTSMGFEVCWV